MAYDARAAKVAHPSVPARSPRGGATWAGTKGVEEWMAYKTKTYDHAENPWDAALVTFAFVISMLVVLVLPAFALI